MQMACSSYPTTYQEQQTELYLLAQFVNEKQEWLDSVITKLGWNKDLTVTKSPLVQCPHDCRHFVNAESLARHSQHCQYITAGLDKERLESFEESAGFTYTGCSNVVPVVIDAGTQQAVIEYVKQQQLQHIATMGMPHAVHQMNQLESLESTEDPPSTVQLDNPIVLIRYIKSWKTVPKSFAVLNTTSLNPVEVKSWLFKNLPDKHLFSEQIGGEIQAVDTIMSVLAVAQTTSPNSVMEKLQPLLQLGVRSFVLSLWKFLAIAKVQHNQSISDAVVRELLPLPVAGQTEEIDSTLVSEIRELVDPSTQPAVIPIPVDLAQPHMSTEEKKTTYDYVVEVSRNVRGVSQSCLNDPNLIRDDSKKDPDETKEEEEIRTASESRRNYLEQLKEQRDYKRRRQSYRAKNVHITRRTPVQIFRDIIRLRMREMGVEDTADEAAEKTEEPCDKDESSSREKSRQKDDQSDRYSRSDSRRTEYRRSSDREEYRRRSRSHKSRSRSRERHHKHKHKSKKHKHTH